MQDREEPRVFHLTAWQIFIVHPVSPIQCFILAEDLLGVWPLSTGKGSCISDEARHCFKLLATHATPGGVIRGADGFH